jgi:hypothetical protein
MNINKSLESEMDILLRRFGSTLTLDTLHLYANTFFALLGFTFNLLSFVVFNKSDEFKHLSLYKYLRIYTLNSALTCLACAFLFTAFSKRYFEWSNSYLTNAYALFVYLPLANTGYFFGTVLDILITLDRVTFLSGSVRRRVKNTSFDTLNLHLTCFIAYILCLIFNLPYFFVFTPHSSTFRLESTGEQFTMWYIFTTPFARSNLGIIITFLIYSIRDIGLMILEIILNIVSMFYLRVYLIKKAQLVKSNIVLTPRGPCGSSDSPNSSSLSKPFIEIHSAVNCVSIGRNDYLINLEKKLTIMVFTMSLLSVLEHILLLACILYPTLVPEATWLTFCLYFLGNFAITIKHSANFFLFFSFNNCFRNNLYKLFQRKKSFN